MGSFGSLSHFFENPGQQIEFESFYTVKKKKKRKQTKPKQKPHAVNQYSTTFRNM